MAENATSSRLIQKAALALLVGLFGAGGVKGIFSFQELGTRFDARELRAEAREKELLGKIEEQTKALATLQLTLVEIRAQGSARDATSDRLAAQLSDVVKQLREVDQARIRDAEQLREHERRLVSIETQGRK